MSSFYYDIEVFSYSHFSFLKILRSLQYKLKNSTFWVSIFYYDICNCFYFNVTRRMCGAMQKGFESYFSPSFIYLLAPEVSIHASNSNENDHIRASVSSTVKKNADSPPHLVFPFFIRSFKPVGVHGRLQGDLSLSATTGSIRIFASCPEPGKDR